MVPAWRGLPGRAICFERPWFFNDLREFDWIGFYID
jgi:hypothetical protein